MNRMSSIVAHDRIYDSPFEDLSYRALVFARLNGSTPLYHVAGIQGGPWSAENALARSHKFHGGPCFHCSKSINKGEATIDHVEPTALGGNGCIQNLVISCKPCNAKKGHQVLDFHDPKSCRAWLEALRAQIEERLARLDLAAPHPK